MKRFRRDHDEVLTTKPQYPLNSPRVSSDGVNLRWMLANYHFARLTAKGVNPDHIIFAGFHADSLHHSIRGSMLYIPDARVFPEQVKGLRRFKHLREY